MFVYVRYIAMLCVSIGSVLAVLFSAVLASNAKKEIYDASFSKHASTAYTVAVGLWRPFAPLSARVIQTGYGLVQVPVDTAKFPEEAKRFLEQFPEQRVTLYTFKDGQVRPLASNYYAQAQWMTENGQPIALDGIDRIQRGAVVNQVITGKNHNAQKLKLLQSVISVPRATEAGELVHGCVKQFDPARCKPEVFVEVISDITEPMATIKFYRWLFAGGATALFLVVGGILIITVARAEGIIAKQHEVNLELTAAVSAAEAQSRDKSMFLASISHELRTPLNAIIGFSEIIKTEARANLVKEHQEYIDDIHASGKHLLALINDILDYSKAEAGKLQLEHSEADLLKLVRNSMRMVMPRAEESQVTLVENLPREAVVITTDIKKLKQVMLNLLSNAVKFTPSGGEVRVSVWVDIVTRDVVVEVKDSGIGIAPKDISRVMMPFVQVESTLARRFEGTGLGLPLSKKFIESMGGQFFIESEVNKGTTITIRLPIKPATSPAAAEAPASARQEDDASAFTGARDVEA